MFFTGTELYNHLQNNSINLSPAMAGLLTKEELKNSVFEDSDYFEDAKLSVTQLSKSTCNKIITTVKNVFHIYREDILDTFWLHKWIRPYTVVPNVVPIPQEGDYAVGIEVEAGFTSATARQRVIDTVLNWKHVSIDSEGPGAYGLEVSFTPVLASKLTSNSQALRYIKLLEQARLSNTLYHFNPDREETGIHVCVSSPSLMSKAERRANEGVWGSRLLHVNRICRDLSHTKKIKYFGREPYDYGFTQGNYIEWKLFNSTSDIKKVKRYVKIATSLCALLESDKEINNTTVNQALEDGYNSIR